MGVAMKNFTRVATFAITCGVSFYAAEAQQRPLTASEVVKGGQVGKFEHGTYPSLGNMTHPGVDIVGDCGSPISAWQSGTIVDVVSDSTDRNFNSLGYMVMIDHGTWSSVGKRTFSLYLHLQSAPKLDKRKDLAVGTKVARGDRIGKVGRTGVATGCHLHFEVRHFSSRFHPDWLNIYGKGDKRQSAEFLADWADPKVATFGKSALITPQLESAEIEDVRAWVTSTANVRSKPSTAGSQVLATRGAGSLISGSWVSGDDGKSRWLKVELAAMEVYSPLGPFGYVWEGNLRPDNIAETVPVPKANTQRADLPPSTQMPGLRTGAYVAFPTRCAQASNATLEWWNGQFFAGGRKHPAYPRAVGPAQPNGSQPFVADVKGWEDNKTYRVNFLVLSQSMYERDGLRYSHCSEARLPPTWRDSAPPQTVTQALDSVADEQVLEAPITPKEFREWQGNGNSYGYFCTVRLAGSSLAVRSAPAGRQVASLTNGETFVLLEVRLTPDRETWYRADPLKRVGPGWVSSRFVTCEAMHFD